MFQSKNQLMKTVLLRMNSENLMLSVLLQMLLRITKEPKLLEMDMAVVAMKTGLMAIHLVETTAVKSTTSKVKAVADTETAPVAAVIMNAQEGTTTMTANVQEDPQGDTAMSATMTSTIALATREVPEEMSVTAFQLIRPSRISNSVMSSAMTRLSKTDTARLKITES